MIRFLRAFLAARGRQWAASIAIGLVVDSLLFWSGTFDGVPSGRLFLALCVIGFMIAALVDMFWPDPADPDH